MSTWEEFDDTLSDEDSEEANFCMMANIALEESESDHDEEVNLA